MKIRSAKKFKTAIAQKSSNKSIFEKDMEKVNSPIDLIDIDVISADSTGLSSGRMDLSISSVNEKLIKEGFEEVEIVIEEKSKKKLPKKASAEEIEEIFNRQKISGKQQEEKKIVIDATATFDKKKLSSLVNGSNLEEEDSEELEMEFVKSSNIEIEKQTIPDLIFKQKSQQRDNSGILETRLGKSGESFSDQKIDQISNLTSDLNSGQIIDIATFDRSDFNIPTTIDTDLNLEPEPLLSRLLKSSVTNSGNKRLPSLLKKSEIIKSISRNRKKPQVPLIKSINRRKSGKINTLRKTLDLPGPNTKISIRIRNKKTGEVLRKPFRPRRLKTIPYKEVYPFKKDINLPKIDVASISSSQAIVSLSNIHPRIETLNVYRREISSRPFEDQYELVNTITDPPDSYKFIDDLENARAFKYVCVSDNLPLYSFTVFKNPGFKYENIEEPFSYAYQSGQDVILTMERIPRLCKKLFVYRKSSAEDEELLVDSVSFFGKGISKLKMVDTPSPIEQVIKYRFVGIDANGIENIFEEKPLVTYTAKLGVENANITKFDAVYNRKTDEVNIKGEVIVSDVYIANKDSELKNPTETTLKAASRGQQLVKIQIRRINHKLEQDEIILQEIINPGLSKFKSRLLSLNRVSFNFSDSGENALTFGYTPLFNNTDYTYIARAIVYSLSTELRKVSDFTTIDGFPAPGRLKYTYDPGIFDHPLNVELGILPAGVNEKSYHSADLIGQTSKALSRKIKVLETDIEDSISLTSEIEIDSAFDPVVKLIGEIPDNLISNLDHVAIQLSYDTVKKKDIIDRLFLTESSFVYYDYSFDDLSCNVVSYSLIGIGKDFEVIFKSEPVKVSLKNKKIKIADRRRKSLENYRRRKHFEAQKSKKKPESPMTITPRGRNTDG
jgi:hypothetical protein